MKLSDLAISLTFIGALAYFAVDQLGPAKADVLAPRTATVDMSTSLGSKMRSVLGHKPLTFKVQKLDAYGERLSVTLTVSGTNPVFVESLKCSPAGSEADAGTPSNQVAVDKRLETGAVEKFSLAGTPTLGEVSCTAVAQEIMPVAPPAAR